MLVKDLTVQEITLVCNHYCVCNACAFYNDKDHQCIICSQYHYTDVVDSSTLVLIKNLKKEKRNK